jgi:hypothetical protein
LITFFVDLEKGAVIVVAGTVGRAGCEVRHRPPMQCGRPVYLQSVTGKLHSVQMPWRDGLFARRRPSGYGYRPVHPHNDGPSELVTRPFGGSLIPPSGLRQVPFTASAGGVS